MLNDLFHGPQGKCCLVLFHADELVTSRRFYMHFATMSIIFKCSFKLEGIVLNGFGNIDYGADLKGSK